jgi:aquaporin Z
MMSPGWGRNVGSEFVGTTIVVLGGPGLIVLGREVNRLEFAIGFGLATAISIGVIGAVGNPMFSFALWFARGIRGSELLFDWLGQVLGALFGAAVLFGLNDLDRFSAGTNGWEPGDSVPAGVDLDVHITGFADLGIVMGAELVVCTLVVVVLLSAIWEQPSNATTAAFVGGAVTIASLLLFPVSGAGLNPARSLAMAIFADTDPNALGQVWVFIVVPLLASFAGLLVWLAISDATIDETLLDETFVDTGD